MNSLVRTHSGNVDFIALVALLDAALAITDGDEHSFYDQFNKVDKIKHVIVKYEKGNAIGCGAIKEMDNATMEVKRMFVRPENRGYGVASEILTELEQWANQLGYSRCVLETGLRQTDAIALYKKNGYAIIPNYGQYIGVSNSVCFEKCFFK